MGTFSSAGSQPQKSLDAAEPLIKMEETTWRGQVSDKRPRHSKKLSQGAAHAASNPAAFESGC